MYRSLQTKSTYFFLAVSAGSREVTVKFNFISERIVMVEDR
jgi:hypothetical protein